MTNNPQRWFCNYGYAKFTIFDAKGGNFNLCVGDNLQVIGTYKTPEEAVIALSKKATDNEAWNKFLLDKEVPTKFRDWETEEDD